MIGEDLPDHVPRAGGEHGVRVAVVRELDQRDRQRPAATARPGLPRVDRGAAKTGLVRGDLVVAGRGLIDALLQQLSQRADKADQEAKSLQAIAQLLKTAQDYYTKQATLAEKIISSLMQSPFSRPLAQMMAVMMGMQLANMMNRFEQALQALGADQLTPLWNDADQVAAQSFGYSYPSM